MQSFRISRVFTYPLVFASTCICQITLAASDVPSGMTPLISTQSRCTEKPTDTKTMIELLKKRKLSQSFPDIPDVHHLHLPKSSPAAPDLLPVTLSPGVADPLLEEARNLAVVDDFKILNHEAYEDLMRWSACHWSRYILRRHYFSSYVKYFNILS